MYRAAALLCLLLVALASPARAQTEIHRCVGANGGAVFTDQPCAALQATPVAPAAPTSPDVDSASAPYAPPPILCADNPEALRQSAIDAFAAHNANRMAGLMLWSGYGQRSVVADIRSLNDLMKQPLLDIDFSSSQSDPAQAPPGTQRGGIRTDSFAANQSAAAPSPAAGPPDQLVLHTASTDGLGTAQERHFGVVRQAGCLWLRPED
jgi:hypothetical protein